MSSVSKQGSKLQQQSVAPIVPAHLLAFERFRRQLQFLWKTLRVSSYRRHWPLLCFEAACSFWNSCICCSASAVFPCFRYRPAKPKWA